MSKPNITTKRIQNGWKVYIAREKFPKKQECYNCPEPDAVMKAADEWRQEHK